MTRLPDHRAFTQASELAVLKDVATRILNEGPRAALQCNLSGFEARQWTYTARFWLDTEGEDDGDFAEMVDEHFNPARDSSWALDADFLRDEAAERSVWGML